MTTLGVALAVCASFLVGFLVGDRRGVRQANVILDANMRELFKAIGEEKAERPGGVDEPARIVLH